MKLINFKKWLLEITEDLTILTKSLSLNIWHWQRFPFVTIGVSQARNIASSLFKFKIYEWNEWLFYGKIYNISITFIKQLIRVSMYSFSNKSKSRSFFLEIVQMFIAQKQYNTKKFLWKKSTDKVKQVNG